MRLIENWKGAAKMYSIQLAALISLLGVVKAEILPLMEIHVPDKTYAMINSFIAIALIVARLVKQGPPDEEAVAEEAPEESDNNA